MGNWKKRLFDEVHKKHVMTDPLLKKGHVHKEPDFLPSQACPACGGFGEGMDFRGNTIECPDCEGTGETYE